MSPDSKERTTRRSQNWVHPVTLSHGIVVPLIRQCQALFGYGEALKNLPNSSLSLQNEGMLTSHLNNSRIFGMQAFYNAIHVLEQVLVSQDTGILPLPKPYGILSTLHLLRDEIVKNMEELNIEPTYDMPRFDPVSIPSMVVDWGSFAQARFQVTPMQGQVITQLIEGKTLPEVAEALGQSPETARVHAANVRARVASKTGEVITNNHRLVAIVLLTWIRELSAGIVSD